MVLLRDADVFWLGEKAQSFFAAFAADAAGFHPAKGDAKIAHQPAVYPNRAGVDLFGDAMGAIQVLGPDAGRKAVVSVVRVTDHFVFVIERRDRNDRAENFFAIGPTCDWKIDNHRRSEEIAVAGSIGRRFRRFAPELAVPVSFL